MIKKLAIVIPAYKITYLSETLDSIANQTCKDFTLYIGDDASPSDLYSVVNKYETAIEIIYNKFDANLGSTDLVAHWNRCVDMAGNEEWIWLFSDDDLMDSTCVELFYDHILYHADDDLLHFDVQVIDQLNKNLFAIKPFPDILTTADFFYSRVRSEINSYVVEYIFRQDLFYSQGKFENFDLAWSADDATWIKFANNSGIKTISGALVKWRYSQINISSIMGDKAVIKRKIDAGITYLNWVDRFFRANYLVDATTDFEKFKSVCLTMIKSSSIPVTDKFKYTLYSLKKLGYKNLGIVSIFYLAMGLIKKQFVNKA